MQQNVNAAPPKIGAAPMLLAILLLVTGLTLTGMAVHRQSTALREESWRTFSQQLDRLEASVRAQFEQPLRGLDGLNGLFAANGRFQSQTFRAWVTSHNLAEDYPGAHGFGFMERVPRSQRDSFVAAERKNQSTAFTLVTRGDAPDMYVVKYIEPLERNLTLWGWDAGNDTAVREAIERVILTGESSLARTSNPGAQNPWSGDYVLLAPLYKPGAATQTTTERQAALVGLVFAPIVLEDLLLPTLFITNGVADFELRDGPQKGAGAVVFSSRNAAHAAAAPGASDFSTRQFHNSKALVIGGRRLAIEGGSNATFESNLDRQTPAIIGAGGILLSSLLALIFWMVLVGRARAQALAMAMTQDLNRLAHVVRSTSHVVMVFDLQRNIVWVNEAFTHFTGISADAAVGQNFAALFGMENNPPAFLSQTRAAQDRGESLRMQVPWTSANGEKFWFDLDFQAELDASGKISGYVAVAADITSQQRVSEQLANALRENQALMDTIDQHSIVSIADHRGSITYVNDMFCQISGYSREELMGGNHRIVKSGQQGHAFWEQMWKTITSGCTWRATVCNQARDGHLYWVDMAIAPFFDEAGNIEKYVSICSDITPAHAAQAELLRSNQVMQSILDNIPVALSVFDGALNLAASNAQFAQLLELPQQLFDVPVTSFESIIRYNASRGEYGDGDVEQTVQAIVERARHVETHRFERVRPNGLALEVRGAPMPGGGFVTTYADISERKKAEAEIARTTAMLQSVLDSASTVSVIAVDMDGVITLFNKGAERLLGYRAEDLIGKHTPEIFFDAAELQARNAALAMQLGSPVQGLQALTDDSTLGKRAEWTYIRQDGHRFSAAVVVTAMTGSNGQRIGYLGVSFNITQEKNAQLVLRAAMEEAEQAAMAKGQFLANMSHEIRTPMNAILGMLKLLHGTPLDSRQEDYTTKAESAARSLLELLNDILDFSKVEAGKMQLDPQPFQLDRVLRDLSVILSASAGGKDLEVLYDIDPALPDTLVGDSIRLQQILTNLGSNAIKFTERGEVVVSIALQALQSGQATLRFTVRDSGIGIAPEKQQLIFTGFAQAEASTTRRFGGTGLGLSICKRLVEMMGGTLDLHSVPGQGSSFYFSITLPVATPTTTPQPARPLAVLVVDDNATARDAMARTAQALHWTVDTAEDGAQALQRIEARAAQGQPDYGAIFVDWDLHAMAGEETAQRMRQLPAAKAPPIVFLVTAHGRETLTERGGKNHADQHDFLAKPVTASMLRDVVQGARARLLHPGGTPGSPTVSKPQRLKGMRLLVVEDNLINQQVAKELLRAEGADITLAGNGQLGVDAVARAQPQFDAVLMDIQMPVMDGYTATVAIRQTLGLQDLPVIAMTANAARSDREACLAAGMNDHIGKPFDLPRLVAMLQQHARPKDVTPAAAPTPPRIDAPQGYDTDGALARLDGNTALYRQILQGFLHDIAGLPDQLDGLLKRHARKEAVRAAHTAKGLALTVGATPLATACSELEQALNTSGKARHAGARADLSALQARVRSAVADTREALQPVLDHLPPLATDAQPAASLDDITLVHDLQELHGLLQSSDLRATDVLAALVQRARPSRALDALQVSVSALDFAQAVVQCEALMHQRSPGTPP